MKIDPLLHTANIQVELKRSTPIYKHSAFVVLSQQKDGVYTITICDIPTQRAFLSRGFVFLLSMNVILFLHYCS